MAGIRSCLATRREDEWQKQFRHELTLDPLQRDNEEGQNEVYPAGVEGEAGNTERALRVVAQP